MKNSLIAKIDKPTWNASQAPISIIMLNVVLIYQLNIILSFLFYGRKIDRRIHWYACLLVVVGNAPIYKLNLVCRLDWKRGEGNVIGPYASTLNMYDDKSNFLALTFDDSVYVRLILIIDRPCSFVTNQFKRSRNRV